MKYKISRIYEVEFSWTVKADSEESALELLDNHAVCQTNKARQEILDPIKQSDVCEVIWPMQSTASKIGRFQKKFNVNDRVIIDATFFGGGNADRLGNGTILGLASEGLIDQYIVLLDNPLPTTKAIVVPSSALT